MGISNKVRFEVLRRDGFRCAYCGAHGEDVVLHIDHIQARANGGADDPSNLITACQACNSGKSAKDIFAGGAKPMKKEGTRLGLVGKCFVTLGEDGRVSRQGIVRERITETLYLIQYFDWLVGEPNTMHVVDIGTFVMRRMEDDRAPGGVILFEDDKHMRYWLEEGFGQHLMRGRARGDS